MYTALSSYAQSVAHVVHKSPHLSRVLNVIWKVRRMTKAEREDADSRFIALLSKEAYNDVVRIASVGIHYFKFLVQDIKCHGHFSVFFSSPVQREEIVQRVIHNVDNEGIHFKFMKRYTHEFETFYKETTSLREEPERTSKRLRVYEEELMRTACAPHRLVQIVDYEELGALSENEKL